MKMYSDMEEVNTLLLTQTST